MSVRSRRVLRRLDGHEFDNKQTHRHIERIRCGHSFGRMIGPGSLIVGGSAAEGLAAPILPLYCYGALQHVTKARILMDVERYGSVGRNCGYRSPELIFSLRNVPDCCLG